MVTNKTKTGFTLIELLVVIAIIALLLSILLPGLKRAKEYAKRVVCASRLRQVGTGLKMYADAFNDYLPDDHDVSGGRESHTYLAYKTGEILANGKYKPFRFAYLYELDYMELPELFYCPGNNKNLMPHFVYESYTNPEPWGTLDQVFNTETNRNQWVRTGYTYYPVESNAKLNAAMTAPVELATKHVRLSPNIPCVTDVIHNRHSISHQHNEIYTLNALYSDGHVSNCNDQSVFNDLMSLTGVDVWDALDNSPSESDYNMAVFTVFRAIGP